jgi:cellulose synthase/poly-beta-1,6-N-acetylglucosamine synthase-like glycosyltransferase
MKLKENSNKLKKYNEIENLNNQHNKKKNFFLFLLKNIIYFFLIIFIVIVWKIFYRNNIIKIINKDKYEIFLKKNWENLSNEILLNEIKFSIIIPVYNTEKWIEESLFSVLTQSIRGIEIICVNDGSKDKSKEMIQKIASIENRIILINQENKGVSAARNAALDFAVGEYLLFLDPDDMFRNESLNDLLNIAKKEKVEVIYFDAFVFFMPEIIFDINKINYYKRSKSYGFMSGKDLFSNIIMNEQFSDSACLMMINRKWLNSINIL